MNSSNKVITATTRRRKHIARTTGIEALEIKIEKAQMEVVKTKQKYDGAVAKLGDLMNKRDALGRDKLVAKIMKSDKTYEEIIRFRNDNHSEEE